MRISWDVAVSSCALLLLSGCAGVLVSTTIETTSVPGTALQGKVHGGQQPVVGASVYLYAANTTGYAGPGIAASSSNASVSLLTSASNTTKDTSGNYYVTTDSGGNFAITGDYTCPSASSQVYIYSVGGNPGAGTNSAAGLLAALGTCATPITTSFIFVDEVSTIATAYAIASFATDATHVSSSGSTLAQTGIANAFAAVTNLETLSTGLALATTPAANGGNGTVPQSEINTLANILAGCINSTGPTFTACSTLLSNAKNGSTTPNDTATAAINIAHNPGANIATLCGLATASAPFQPTLSAAPNDFTIAISYTAGGLAQPEGIAIDSSGNMWVANEENYPSFITELSSTGKALSGTNGYAGGGLNMPSSIAIDGSGYVWVPNEYDTLSKFNPNGTAVSGSPFTGGGLNEDELIAIDGSGYVWITNHGNSSLSKFDSSGTAITVSTGYTGGGMSDPQGIAIDTSGNVWVTDIYPNGISEFNSSGSAVSGSPFTGGGLNMPSGIAIDGSGNLWVSNNISAGSLSEFNSSGTAISGSAFTGGGLDYPGGIAIDGAGNVWAANDGNGSLSEFNPSGTAISGSSGFQGGLESPIGIAIDGSGNIWVSNAWPTNTIVEFVGVAAPVVTPMVANLISPYGGHAVNKP